MGKVVHGLLVLAFSLVGVAPAAAQSPTLVYTVPGAVSGGGLATVITCTALVPQSVTVQAIDGSGSAGGNATLSFAAYQTQVFGTLPAGGLSVDVSLSAYLAKGFIQILSTSKSLICSAIISDTLTILQA